jgi:hypothetical protein
VRGEYAFSSGVRLRPDNDGGIELSLPEEAPG